MPTYIKPVKDIAEEKNLQENYKTLSSFVMSTDRRVTRLMSSLEKTEKNNDVLWEKYNTLLEEMAIRKKNKNLRKILSFKAFALAFAVGAAVGGFGVHFFL